MTEKQKVLIVDDRKENLFALEMTLKKIDVQVISALSGEEALRVVMNNNLALAILDVQMPDMDGYELADLLRGDTSTQHLPIIFMSAVYSDDSHVFKGYESGAVDFIVKPYNPAHLLSKVYVFLELNRVHSELKEKVNLLAVSEESFRSLVRTIPDIVYRINEEGKFIFINQAVTRIGYNPEELIGRHFSTIIHPEDVDQVSRNIVLPKYQGKTTGANDTPKLFDERRNGDRKTFELEIRLLSKKHETIHRGKVQNLIDDFVVVEVNSSGIHGSPGPEKSKVFLGTVGVIRDITMRKKAETELATYRNHLEELVEDRTDALQTETDALQTEIKAREHIEDEARKLEARMVQQQRLESIGTLAGGVAHEINNPINGIMNYAQLILDQEDENCSKAEYAAAIIDETKRVAVIVRNLLQFAREDNQSSKSNVPVSEMIDYVLSLVRTIVRHDQISLHVDIPEDIPKTFCKSSEVEQVLMNLLTNACDSLNEKYAGYDENKLIRIAVSTVQKKNKEYIRITIEDRGTGISEAVQARMFEPFFTTKDRTKGTGLGLSISHGIIDNHGGELSAESSLGEFTRFHLDLPAAVSGGGEKG